MAARAIMESVVASMYQLERDDEMTDRERRLVEDQIVKLKERIEKMLGYEPGSWTFI
jgi:hypothetical protein